MSMTKDLAVALLTLSVVTGPLAGWAAETKAQTKPKPYTLQTCVVSDGKLGEMGEPYAYVHEGREIKFCCKGCLKDFKKDPAKYLKKIDEAEAKAAKGKS